MVKNAHGIFADGGEGGLANTQEKLKIKKNESVANHSAMGWAEMGIKTWR